MGLDMETKEQMLALIKQAIKEDRDERNAEFDGKKFLMLEGIVWFVAFICAYITNFVLTLLFVYWSLKLTQ